MASESRVQGLSPQSARPEAGLELCLPNPAAFLGSVLCSPSSFGDSGPQTDTDEDDEAVTHLGMKAAPA